MHTLVLCVCAPVGRWDCAGGYDGVAWFCCSVRCDYLKFTPWVWFASAALSAPTDFATMLAIRVWARVFVRYFCGAPCMLGLV